MVILTTHHAGHSDGPCVDHDDGVFHYHATPYDDDVVVTRNCYVSVGFGLALPLRNSCDRWLDHGAILIYERWILIFGGTFVGGALASFLLFRGAPVALDRANSFIISKNDV